MRNLTLLTLMILGALFAVSARADEMYTLSFATTSGQIESFGFSFIVPTFVTTGQSPAFTPFTITDGTNTSAPLSLDLAENLGSGASCFSFATATNATIDPPPNGPCNSEWNAPNGGFVQFLFLGNALPTAEGTYTGPGSVAGFYFGPSSADFSIGTGVLTISAPSSVPEPTSVILMSTTLLEVAFVARKRLGRGTA